MATSTVRGVQQEEPVLYKFIFGGLSCAAPLPIVNPVEVIKIRLQLQGELANERNMSTLSKIYGAERKYQGTLRGIIQIIREERIAGLYKGIVPAALREMSYAAFRLAFYDPIKLFLGEDKSKNEELPFYKKILAGALAGSIGAGLANPTDVIKVRMQAQGGGQRPKYSSSWQCFYLTLRHEGIKNGLWKGVVANTQRAAILSAAMMPSYDHTKRFLLKNGWIKEEGPFVHITAAMFAGFLMSVVSCPIDVTKTRIMNRNDNSAYTGMINCLYKTYRAEGLQGLYKGFLPTFLRLGPHTIMALVIYEKLRQWAGMTPV